jgi:preprotein translocase subunit SecE
MQVKTKPTKKDEPNKPGRPALLETVQKTLRDTRSELKKVTWPTREQTVRLTVVVGAVSMGMGIFLGAVDYIFETLLKILLGGGM